MKRAEAETIVRSITRRCRGPHTLTPADAIAHLTRGIERDRARARAYLSHPENDPAQLPAAIARDAHEATWFTAAIAGQLAALPTVRDIATALLRIGQTRAASYVDAAARAGGCGADVNDAIVAAPFDGEEHLATCPRCAVVSRFTAPYFEIDAGDPTRRAGDPTPVVTGATDG